MSGHGLPRTEADGLQKMISPVCVEQPDIHHYRHRMLRVHFTWCTQKKYYKYRGVWVECKRSRLDENKCKMRWVVVMLQQTRRLWPLLVVPIAGVRWKEQVHDLETQEVVDVLMLR